MSVTNLTFRQQGNFIVEFAIVGIALSLLLTFSADVIVKLSYKGKLDRLSYSMVNLLKERTQLYGDGYSLGEDNVRDIVNITKGSLHRMGKQFDEQKFGFRIEAVTFDSQQTPTYQSFPQSSGLVSEITCTLSHSLNDMTYLSKVTTWGRRAALYRVTFCYDTANWFGRLFTETFTRVQSSSVIIGR
jgi:tight adherence protein F